MPKELDEGTVIQTSCSQLGLMVDDGSAVCVGYPIDWTIATSKFNFLLFMGHHPLFCDIKVVSSVCVSLGASIAVLISPHLTGIQKYVAKFRHVLGIHATQKLEIAVPIAEPVGLSRAHWSNRLTHKCLISETRMVDSV